MVDEDVFVEKLRHVNRYVEDSRWFERFQQEVAQWFQQERA